ncbi:MAG: hypothetical protein BWY85_01228 [Firmicutes bacterium ADurb.Bin506]|nr:MAG: hypothetical protein BWY85_01228 [Firmicutes bacterium ADurb.Bin506]
MSASAALFDEYTAATVPTLKWGDEGEVVNVRAGVPDTMKGELSAATVLRKASVVSKRTREPVASPIASAAPARIDGGHARVPAHGISEIGVSPSTASRMMAMARPPGATGPEAIPSQKAFDPALPWALPPKAANTTLNSSCISATALAHSSIAARPDPSSNPVAVSDDSGESGAPSNTVGTPSRTPPGAPCPAGLARATMFSDTACPSSATRVKGCSHTSYPYTLS